MAILLMRPFPENEKTANVLRSAGYRVLLSPALRFEPLPVADDASTQKFDAVIATSANALRGIEGHPLLEHLHKLKFFAVGDVTSEKARTAGFANAESARGDAADLAKLIDARLRGSGRLCYLAGADLSRDLAAELGPHGYTVVTIITYKMVPIPRFSEGVLSAFAAGEVEAIMHYSRRSARGFVEAVQAAGLEISVLALPQCCISHAVATVLRDAGASRVMVAETPDESAMLDVLVRGLPPSLTAMKSAKM